MISDIAIQTGLNASALQIRLNENPTPLRRALYDMKNAKLSPLGECFQSIREQSGDFDIETKVKGVQQNEMPQFVNFVSKVMTLPDREMRDIKLRMDALVDPKSVKFGQYDLSESAKSNFKFTDDMEKLGITHEQLKVAKDVMAGIVAEVREKDFGEQPNTLFKFAADMAALSLKLQQSIPDYPNAVAANGWIKVVDTTFNYPDTVEEYSHHADQFPEQIPQRLVWGWVGKVLAEDYRKKFSEQVKWDTKYKRDPSEIDYAHGYVATVAGKGSPRDNPDLTLLYNTTSGNMGNVKRILAELKIPEEVAKQDATRLKQVSSDVRPESNGLKTDTSVFEQTMKQQIQTAEQIRRKEMEIQAVFDQAEAIMDVAARDLQKIAAVRTTHEKIDYLLEPYAAMQRDVALVAGEQRRLFGDAKPPDGFDYSILTLDSEYPRSISTIQKLAEEMVYIPKIYGEGKIDQAALKALQDKINAIMTGTKLNLYRERMAVDLAKDAILKFQEGDTEADPPTPAGLTHEQLLAGRNRLAILQKPLPEKQEPDAQEMEQITSIRSNVAAALAGLETKTPVTITV